MPNKTDRGLREGCHRDPLPEPVVRLDPAHAVQGREMRHPSTSDVDYTLEEVEFLRALQRYKDGNGRPCPTMCEVLAVARSIGYRKVEQATNLPHFTRNKGAREGVMT